MKNIKTKLNFVLSLSLVSFLMFGFVNSGFAQSLPQQCVDAGITNEDVCKSYLGSDPSNTTDQKVYGYQQNYASYDECVLNTDDRINCLKAFPDGGRLPGNSTSNNTVKSFAECRTNGGSEADCCTNGKKLGWSNLPASCNASAGQASSYAECIAKNGSAEDCCAAGKQLGWSNLPASCTATPGTGGGGNGAVGVCGDSRLEMINGICVPKSSGGSGSLSGAKTLQELLLKIIQTALALAGVAGVLYLIYGGYLYITSGGNDEQAESGKKALVNAIIGIVIVIMSYTIVNVIIKSITENSVI